MTDENDLADPEAIAAARKALRKMQRMVIALQQIIQIDADRSAVSMWARKALEEKDF